MTLPYLTSPYLTYVPLVVKAGYFLSRAPVAEIRVRREGSGQREGAGVPAYKPTK